MPRITLQQFQDLINEQLPVVRLFNMQVEHIGRGDARMRMLYTPEMSRPGGTVSGPALMALADVTMYAVVLGLIGQRELAVTTNLSTNFLRRPPPADVVAEGRILKLGRRLAVGEVSLSTTAGEGDLVAHVTGTYSIPPAPSSGQ